jgi:hypothetical protein
MRRYVHLGAIVALCVVSASCGGGDDASGSYVDQLEDACKTFENEIEDLDAADDLKAVEQNADDASALLEDAIADMEKVDLPSSADEAKDLIDNFGEQLDLIDDVAKAAGDDDADKVADALEDLGKVGADAAELADDIDARRCSFDEDLFTAALGGGAIAAPPETDPTNGGPPITEPPITDPPITEPTVPEPTVTQPPATEPPPEGPEAAKTPIDVTQILPNPTECAFVDPDDEILITLFESLLNFDPTIRATTGAIGAVNISLAADGSNLGVMYLFTGDGPLQATVEADLLPIFDGESTGVPLTVAGESGYLITGESGPSFFSASVDAVIWVLGPTQAAIETALTCVSAALG